MPLPVRLAAAAAVLGLGLAPILAGCGSSTSTSTTSGDSASTSPTKEASGELGDLWAQFKAVADRPALPLTRDLGLKPTAGFTQADVDALAGRGVDVLKRGIQPRLSKMDPTNVINYVFAHQYAPTTFQFKSTSSDLSAGYDYDWLAASLYEKAPAKAPKIIKVAATVTSGKGKLDDGTVAPLLRVTIQIHAAQKVTTAHGEVPIVVRRTAQVSGFKPRGGADYWPSVLVRTYPFGNAECPLYDGSKLIPLTDPGDLRKDLVDLKISLSTKGLVPQTFGATTSTAEMRKYVKKTCNS